MVALLVVAGQGSRAENRTLQDFSGARTRRIPMPARSDTELGGCTSLVCHNQGRLPSPVLFLTDPKLLAFPWLFKLNITQLLRPDSVVTRRAGGVDHN